MTQTTSRLFDELAKLMTDAAGAAKGVRGEVETMMRSQAEKMLRELDVVSREEFEAVKAMAQKAREENEALKARIVALEGGPKPKAGPAKRPAAKPRAAKVQANKTATKRPAASARSQKASAKKAGTKR